MSHQGIRRLICLAERYADDLAADARRPDGSWADDPDAEEEWHRWIGAIHQARRELHQARRPATQPAPATQPDPATTAEDHAIDRALARTLARHLRTALGHLPPTQAAAALASYPRPIRTLLAQEPPHDQPR